VPYVQTARILPGCKVFRNLYIAVLLS
jgi:hypothetical protein